MIFNTEAMEHKMKKTSSFFLTLTVLVLNMPLPADIRLPAIFSDNMVLQQNKPIKIWGWAKPDEKIVVTLDDKAKHTSADSDGNWSVVFESQKSDTKKHTLTVSGENQIVLKNILLGEVWVCSGQSNMEMAVKVSKDAAKEISEANYPFIRLFDIERTARNEPADDYTPKDIWLECSSQSIPNFSATAYFLGRDLHKNLNNVPIGLISSNWGGTGIEAWTPMEYLEKIDSVQARLKQSKAVIENLKSQGLVEKYTAQNSEYKKSFRTAVKQGEGSVIAKKYSSLDFDDSSWKTMTAPALFEQFGLKDFHGYVWFRKHVQIPSSWAGKDIILHLGPIDEIDVTWLNGVEVGRSGSVIPKILDYWNVSREYRVDGKNVKAGDNLIAIRMADTSLAGGFGSTDPTEMYCESANNSTDKISLAGQWKFMPANELPTLPRDPSNPNTFSVLYNGMIQPLTPFAIRGVIWYQGEANAPRAYQYRTLMPTMIKAWRDKFGDPDMPFIITQLPNYCPSGNAKNTWPELREAQLMTCQNDPNCKMAVTIDLGEPDNIHPKNKQDVGKRLGLLAREHIYGQNICSQGPVFKSMQIDSNKVRVQFDNVCDGLVVKGPALKGFEIAGEDKKFFPVEAAIDSNAVVLWSDIVPVPVAVRYAWADNPECNLYNKAGLPAGPFRTDDWQCVTFSRN